MFPSRWLKPTLAAALLLHVASAQAQTTAADAAALQQAVHDFFDQLTGLPAVSAALTPKVTAEGDHLRLELGWPKLGGADSFSLDAGSLTANAKPLSGGRWALDDVRYPTALEGSSVAGEPTGPVSFRVSLDDQKISLVVDPSLATTSTADVRLTGYTLRTETRQGTQTYRIEATESHSVLQPAEAGHIDLRSDASQTGTAITTLAPGGTPINVGIDKLTGKTRVKNFALRQLGGLLQDVAALARSPAVTDAAASAAPASADTKAIATRALQVIAGLMDSLDSDYTATGIQIKAAEGNFGIKKFGLGLHLGSEDGALQASLPLLIDGIDAPDLVSAGMRDVMPRRASITPTIGGLAKPAITALLQQGIDGKIVGQDAWQAAFLQLLSDNPVTVGFEDLAVDFGVARLEGDGEVEVSSPTDLTGKAEFRVTGLDALIKRANATPELKQAAPVLIFLKGIGEQNGKETVWRVGYDDGHFIVNDTDLSDMAPGTGTPGRKAIK